MVCRCSSTSRTRRMCPGGRTRSRCQSRIGMTRPTSSQRTQSTPLSHSGQSQYDQGAKTIMAAEYDCFLASCRSYNLKRELALLPAADSAQPASLSSDSARTLTCPCLPLFCASADMIQTHGLGAPVDCPCVPSPVRTLLRLLTLARSLPSRALQILCRHPRPVKVQARLRPTSPPRRCLLLWRNPPIRFVPLSPPKAHPLTPG
jgi:hypothetical protein